MTVDVTGVVPPVLTPLTADREVDAASLERLVGHLVENGVHGLFVLGSSSEVVFMDPQRRARVLDVVTGAVAGQVPVLVGAIDMQVGPVLAHVREAERAGADGVVVTPPFYAITGPMEVERHFRAIAAGTSLPVWAYDIPVCTHVKLLPEALMVLASEGLLAGVKDSSGDDVAFRRLALMNVAAGSPMRLLTGHEVVVDGAYLAGADGVVPGLGNVDPAGYVRLHEAARAGDWEAARREQDRLATLFEMVFDVPDRVGPAQGIGAFKTALAELGVIAGNTMHEPMAPLGEQHARRIRARLEAAGLA
ncbi:dihydrodipicolinate synthase family protein [Micrococcus luteus]|uniref:dihydrodipicolinate synthase family protein n=1 Tax=Micrococcus luteus TaxID=1270 RepID=UPI0011A8EC79|nr:dihydrodipicolinate synthase family protein [Micrococcus luteus]MCV7488144.1 dihydrodipicolinate synthase family protein [Micrococcus luteus]MCV7701835.1 dihydrodipicolinate synthase family protein [Micrococcus luteus]